MEYKPRRKPGQGYEHEYNKRAKFFDSSKGKAIKIAGSICITCLIIVGVIFINYDRFSLLLKGYSFGDTSVILNLEDGTIQDYLDKEEKISLSYWDTVKNNQHYYDYDLYASYKEKLTQEEVVDYVDKLFNDYDSLKTLGYDLTFIRNHESYYSISDFEYLINNQLTYEKTKKYFNVNGCIPTDMEKYLKSKKDPQEAILSISYPMIDSSKYDDIDYEVLDPSDLLTLAKKGFHIASTYEPEDLVNVDVLKQGNNTKMRKEAAEQLEKLCAAAEKEGLYIGIRSAYRSYNDQQQVYDEYFAEYDEVTASQLVSLPGTSEHQLGLGVDLTSQSVIDGDKNTFGDTEEYQWIIKHGHEYGFILRYPDDSTEETGAMNEPWHFRYVGVEAATEIYENDWTLEDYILHHGFNYNLKIYTTSKN